MKNLKQAVVKTLLQLPDTANFKEIQAVLETFREEFGEQVENVAGVSAYELAKDLFGCVDGPPDLSTNKAYFEGFGL